MSEYTSTLTEMFSGKDMNVEGDLCHLAGSDTLTAVKSITKCIRIISPGILLLFSFKFSFSYGL